MVTMTAINVGVLNKKTRLSYYMSTYKKGEYMEHVVVGNNSFVIDENRVVKRVDGKPTQLPETKNTITISLYGYVKEVKKEWLYWLSFFKLKLPVGYEDRVFDYEFLDIFSLKHMKVDPMMVVFKKPVYLKNNNNFRIIARFPNYAISTAGVIHNIRKNTYKKPRDKHNAKYLVTTITDQAKLYSSDSMLTHRLVAATWVNNDDFTKYYLVDHIDGNKTNCHYTNLRWVDHKFNNKATSEQGLRTDNIVVLSRNIDTGEVKEHASVTQATEHMGRSRINTSHTKLLPRKIWKGTNGRFELKRKDDNREWYYLNNTVKPPFKHTMNITVDIDGKSHKFISIKEAGIALLGNDKPRTIEMFKEELSKKHPKYKLEIVNITGYEAKDKDGNIYTADTVRKLAEEVKVPFSTVLKYLSLGIGYNGWLFRKKSEYPTPWSNDIGVKSNKKEVLVFDTDKKVTTLYDSMREAGRSLNVDKKTIVNFANDGRLLFNKFKISLSA